MITSTGSLILFQLNLTLRKTTGLTATTPQDVKSKKTVWTTFFYKPHYIATNIGL